MLFFTQVSKMINFLNRLNVLSDDRFIDLFLNIFLITFIVLQLSTFAIISLGY